MKVKLVRNWFNPKGHRMRVTGKGTVYDMPDEWKDKLPSTAVIVEEDFVEPSVDISEPETFSELNKLQEMKRDTAEAIAEDTHNTLEASKKEQAKRNRQAGAKRAREARLAKNEEMKDV